MISAYNISSYAQFFGSFSISILGIVFFAKRDLPFRLLTLYGLNSFLFQVSGLVIEHSGRAGDYLNLNGNIYTLFEVTILLAFFYSLFSSSSTRKIILFIIAGYFVLYFFLMKNHWTEFVGSIRTMRDLSMIVCALMYFYFLLKEMPTTEILKYPLFWVMAGMLFYFSGTFALSLSIDYLVKALRDDVAVLWIGRNYFRFLFCMVVCYGLWLDLNLIRSGLVPAK